MMHLHTSFSGRSDLAVAGDPRTVKLTWIVAVGSVLRNP